jgi:hypothetical protein
LSAKIRYVKEYLDELEKTKTDRPDQVKEGLEIYIDLWRKAIQRGVVSESDSVDEALRKIDEKGGLYKATGEEAG